MASPMRRLSGCALPDDIVSDIFTKLPGKSLTRFECLSKDWSILFKTPQFTASHHRNSTQTNPVFFLERQYCLVSQRELWALRIFLLAPKTMELEFRLPIKGFIVGTSKGLVCLTAMWSKIVVWNPATRQSSLPIIPQEPIHIVTAGFCFNSNDNDFKVVILVRKHVTAYDSIGVHVYSLRAGCWKEIVYFDFPDLYFDSEENSVTLNGAIFWPFHLHELMETDQGREYWVVSFDTVTENLEKIELPSSVKHGCPISRKLAIYKDSVAMLTFPQDLSDENYYIDMWVLDLNICDGSGRERWSKIQTVGPFSPLESLVGIWKNEIAMAKGDVIYGIDRGFKAQLPDIYVSKGDTFYDIFNMVNYEESLFPVVSENRVEGDEALPNDSGANSFHVSMIHIEY